MKTSDFLPETHLTLPYLIITEVQEVTPLLIQSLPEGGDVSVCAYRSSELLELRKVNFNTRALNFLFSTFKILAVYAEGEEPEIVNDVIDFYERMKEND